MSLCGGIIIGYHWLIIIAFWLFPMKWQFPVKWLNMLGQKNGGVSIFNQIKAPLLGTVNILNSHLSFNSKSNKSNVCRDAYLGYHSLVYIDAEKNRLHIKHVYIKCGTLYMFRDVLFKYNTIKVNTFFESRPPK